MNPAEVPGRTRTMRVGLKGQWETKQGCLVIEYINSVQHNGCTIRKYLLNATIYQALLWCSGYSSEQRQISTILGIRFYRRKWMTKQ